MKPQRFTTALLNKKPSAAEQIIRWLNENLLFAIASTMAILMIAATLLVVLAQALQSATDYYDNDVSEQISAEWEAKAKAEWITEYGDAQPNLTTESRIYLEKTTALLQEQRNGK